jgi:hypothetical protein
MVVSLISDIVSTFAMSQIVEEGLRDASFLFVSCL